MLEIILSCWKLSNKILFDKEEERQGVLVETIQQSLQTNLDTVETYLTNFHKRGQSNTRLEELKC